MLMKFSLKCVVVSFSALCLSVALQPAKAAVINWGSVQNIVGAPDVLTTGTLFASANFGSASNVTVNGVQFDAFAITLGGTSQTVGNITLAGTSNQPGAENLRVSGTTLGGPASYNGLLQQIGFLTNTTTPPTLAVTISGLTTGVNYLIQYWVNDSRSAFSSRSTIVGGQTLDVNVSNTEGGFGQYITGTFTADSATQSFNAVAGVGGRADANAMQVRAVPEPSMIGIGIVGLVATWQLRRSRKCHAPESRT